MSVQTHIHTQQLQTQSLSAPITSLQLASVALVFLHQLSDLLSLQRRIEDLVETRVSLTTVYKVCQLIQGEEGLPLRTTGREGG